nr:MAG TPA: hypothetical protein [Bacteriophage sp.]
MMLGVTVLINTLGMGLTIDIQILEHTVLLLVIS